MLRYILRRLAGAAVVLTLLSFLVFSLLYLVPGDPVKILVGTRRLTPEVRQAVTARYGLDEPLVVRYWHWLTRALTGDFGDSVRSATPVTDVLSSRVSLTAWLTIGAFLLAVAVGSSHAMATRDAVLDTELIAAIKRAVPVPLVLHGSSGVPDDGMVAAINAGMTKINVSTHLNVVFTSRIRDILLHDPGLVDPRKYVGPATGIVRDEVRRLMELYAPWCAVA